MDAQRVKGDMAYQPIENYGVIGDTQTVALVGMNGSIDWFCFPRFDSPASSPPSWMTRKADISKIAPGTDVTSNRQLYWPETNVLITRFLSPDGVAETTDYMPIGRDMTAPGSRQVVRHVKMVRGEHGFSGPTLTRPSTTRVMPTKPEFQEKGPVSTTPGLSLGFGPSVPLKQDEQGVFAEFTLREGEIAIFLLNEIPSGAGCGLTMNEQEGWEDFKSNRRILASLDLKMLLHGPLARDGSSLRAGAQAAHLRADRRNRRAPTCSLPEAIGGARNSDYRYTWIRDATFTLYALLRRRISPKRRRSS